MRGLKRIRTAVQGFADLCLATRPSDQLVPSRAADYNYNTNPTYFLRIRPSRTGKNRSFGTRTTGRFGASGVQIYKHFQNLQNFRRTLRYFVRGFMLFRKNQYLYFVKRIQRAMSPEDIALQMTPGIGVKSAVHLLDCFGSAARIFAATEEELTGRAALRPEAARVAPPV